MRFLQLIAMAFLLCSCTMHFSKSQDYIAPEDDASLGFFYIDSKDMDGDLEYIYVHQVDPSNEYFIPYDKKSNVAFSSHFRPGKAYYVSDLQAIDDGFMASGAVYNYQFTPQTSLLRVKTEGKKKLVYLGAWKFKYAGNHSWFNPGNFELHKCTDCPSELEQLKSMLALSEKKVGRELKDGGWIGIIQKRINDLEKAKR